MNLDFSNFSATQRYHLMTQTIIPRPIAWALTASEDGSLNLAPFSYFTAVSSEPPILMLSVGKKPNGDDKDTFVNVKNNKQMVIALTANVLAEQKEVYNELFDGYLAKPIDKKELIIALHSILK